MIMVPYVRDQGAIRGWTPSAGKPAVPRTGGFRAPHEPDPNWRQRAICPDEDPELFQPIGSTGFAMQQIEDAKQVCFRCPVMWDCRAWALAMGSALEFGVAGGMSADERRLELRRERRRIARSGGSS